MQHDSLANTATFQKQRETPITKASSVCFNTAANRVSIDTTTDMHDRPASCAKDVNVKLRYGVVNLAFEIEPVEETAV